MNQIVEYESEFGPILIEVESSAAGGLKSISRGDKIEKAQQKFEDAIETIKTVANALVSKTANLVHGPDEFAVEIGLAFKAETGVVIAKASTEGHIKVSMKWTKKAEVPPSDKATSDVPDEPVIS